MGIVIAPTSKPILVEHCDADWAKKANRISCSGYVVTFGGSFLSCPSSKQTVAAMPSTESEFISLSSLCTQLVRLRN